jgi:CheY-like chemotaxis protein
MTVNKPLVLIFDDDANILELCEIILTMKKMRVVGCGHCNNPVETVLEHAPDVILMDNWIPQIGGIKATQLLKNNPATRHIPVIFFSANSHIEDLATAAGADYSLQKPFEIAGLESIILKAMQPRTAGVPATV